MANNTLREALAIEKTPATPKFLSPPTFNPASSDPVQFLETYNRVSLANSWTKKLKISYLPIFLEKAALTWYNQYVAIAGNATKTWEQLCEDFIKEFGGSGSKRTGREKLENRRQGINEDIKSYYFELLALQQEVDPAMTDETFRAYFERGLLPSLSETFYMFSTPEMDRNQLKNLVLKISEIKKRTLTNNMSADSSFLTM